MGLFDSIRWEYPLPDSDHQDLEFQTKDLDSFLEGWAARHGRLDFVNNNAEFALVRLASGIGDL